MGPHSEVGPRKGMGWGKENCREESKDQNYSDGAKRRWPGQF